MIAANTATVRFLEARNFPSIRRILRTPRGGTASSRSPPSWASTCRTSRARPPCSSSSRRRQAADPTRFPDLSLVGRQAPRLRRVRRRAAGRERRRALRPRASRTTRTRPRRTGGSPISSRTACSRRRWPALPCPTATRSSRISRGTARCRKTTPQGGAAGAQVRRGADAVLARSASASTPSSQARRTRARMSACSTRRSRAASSRGRTASTSATASTCNSCTPTSSAAISTSRAG